jgi:uncharacterized protein (TIGR03083 family)
MTDRSIPTLPELLADRPLDGSTACTAWTVRHVAAHLAAGAKELADLIEESLAGRPERATRRFEEREAPMRALPDDELRQRMVTENRRKVAAYAALAERVDDPTILFTGTRISAAELETHSRSEAAIHRWDVVGHDHGTDDLLADPGLTDHAVKILQRMPSLHESARALGERAGRPVRVVFRSPARSDVVFVAGRGPTRLEQPDVPADGDALIVTDPAHRLLVLWGRRSSARDLTLDGDRATVAALPAIVWPDASPWPR